MTVLDVKHEFDLDPDRVWMNASHQGPLPRRAAEAAMQMIEWKSRPQFMQQSAAFDGVIDRLRAHICDLIGARPAEVTLANSASYGLHVVANGLELKAGDEVIVAGGDFPSDILPWLRLEHRGVIVRQLESQAAVPSPDEVRAALTPATRVVCLPWVHSFSGQMVDLEAIGELCRQSNALFVVNASQGIGAIPLAVDELPVDAVTSVGFKWLCGPYGTGFLWLGDRARDAVAPTKLYWLASLSADDLVQPDLDLSSIVPPDVGRHDVFGTANFFNNAPLTAAIELVKSTGVDRIRAHNLELATQLVDNIDPRHYEVRPRGEARLLTSIVFLRPLSKQIGDVLDQLRGAGVDVANRRGMLRLSPHFYNSPSDVAQAVEALSR